MPSAELDRPRTGSSAEIKVAAARAGVDLKNRASIDAADQQYDAIQAASR